MATGKKLKDISITPAPGQVGVSFIFEEPTPAEHFLLTVSVAEQFMGKLEQAVAMAKQPAIVSRAPGDGMGLSDYSALSIVTPKKEQ